MYPSENAISRITQCIRETERLKKPMQVAGCVVGDWFWDNAKLSELKIGSSVYAKKKKETNWICVCLDRNQLLSKHMSSYYYSWIFMCRKSMPLPFNQHIQFLQQYSIIAEEKSQPKEQLITISPLPYIQHLDETAKLSISFISDSVGRVRVRVLISR